ncbi:phosphatidylinositol-specific phospholipase C domain-containing protein [Streptomyces sp. H27-D2]|uniref:phosphatidylinositol-specific phospholipase C domain-containing protein n=1 Tax=Streptomyces sp. H27-D2 TaxID=3046304 RepID=UPI002DB5845E|nr:phosphatidylinositol-specific phospholipase C domain-containing protein [Streptomyces sp. H27-D2]MEC4019375.1 phosphatidylinositol-specific phospholipase C domain-containing protein [Streptomyces sp. H27-D2]
MSGNRRAAIAAICVSAAVIAATAPTPAQAKGADGLSYAAATSVGVHNAYEKSKYPFFADALDSGASLLELDVWTNGFSKKWRVSHSNPIGNDNNCENAASPAELRTKARNQSLDGCLADLRAWHDAHPGHRPVLIKVEMKDGFNDTGKLGPDEFDSLVGGKLGDALYRPADLKGSHATLDAAVQAGGWPSRSALAGKFLFELIPGTVEEGNPFDTLWTDREYATRLRNLSAAGNLGQASSFPAVHGAEAGDPRTARYQDAAIRPWFVFFDGDASAYVRNGIDTKWYDDRHYLVVMTDAHQAAPAIDGTNPTEAQAAARTAEMAAKHASFATADWYPLPSVLSTVLPRG